MRSLRAAAAIACCASALVVVSGPESGATGVASSTLLFSEGASGSWASTLSAPQDFVGPPSVAVLGTTLYVARMDASGDVLLGTSSASGPLVFVDLTSTYGVPSAKYAPRVVADPDTATIEVWFTTTSGDLEVAWSTSGAPFASEDVSVASDLAPLASSPDPIGGFSAAVTTAAGRLELVSGQPGEWQSEDPMPGSTYPTLFGTPSAAPAPLAPGALLVVARTTEGELLAFSDASTTSRTALAGFSMFALRAPLAGGDVSVFGGVQDHVVYVSSGGDLIDATVASSTRVATSYLDLTRREGVDPAAASTVEVVGTGPKLLIATSDGDPMIVDEATARSVDLSFHQGTQRLTSGDVVGAMLSGHLVVVGEDAGPIAPNALRRAIVLEAASFDQQHAGYVETPPGSNCNRFTGAFGRGWRSGCAKGSSAEEWCSDFAQWVWSHEGVATSGIDGASDTFISWGQVHHRVRLGDAARALPGDAVVWGSLHPFYGAHVGIVVGVASGQIDIVSGNSGPSVPVQGNIAVWRSGTFDEARSTVDGFHVLGVVSP